MDLWKQEQYRHTLDDLWPHTAMTELLVASLAQWVRLYEIDGRKSLLCVLGQSIFFKKKFWHKVRRCYRYGKWWSVCMAYDVCEYNLTFITVAHYWLFRRPRWMITILLHCIANRMQRVCYARECYNSDTHCGLKFFRFLRNHQW